eukprot:TRINITY_DN9251_c0_g1_i1.p1 TRINITY_DN9251_c0_g1~~TRINITY_DN9251_c0_g1_i1.p1  ORF type:complete len:152 (+),score=28.26 TRINITY_DN9251_c0_g1_i1:89-544(+)
MGNLCALAGGAKLFANADPRVLEVTVVSATNLPKMDTFGKTDPYVVIRCGTTEMKTKVLKSVMQPVWNHRMMIAINPDVDFIQVALYDWDKMGNNELVGDRNVPISDLRANQSTDMTVNMKLARQVQGAHNKQPLKVQLKLKPLGVQGWKV